MLNTSSAKTGLHQPYAEPQLNFFYNLLFCDQPELFAPRDGAALDPWRVLLASAPDTEALRAIAEDASQEGRLRALAYHRLRAAGAAVPERKLLGVIVEVPLAQGLDVLAAFSEGGVRYLNQAGKMAIFEGAGHPVEQLAKDLLAVAEPVLAHLGPWDQPRLPPPGAGRVRLSFLVSDGLYFGEGPFAAFQQDAMAGPILAKATELLLRVVEVAAP